MTVDPFVSSHRVSENYNTYIDAIAKIWNEIAEKSGAGRGVELIHHVCKAAYDSHEFTVDDGRRDSALLAASCIAEVLNPMSKDEAASFGILEPQRRSFFRCDNGKSSMSPPPDKAKWFKFESVSLENSNDVQKSDNVGVVTAWTPPKPLDNVTGAHAEGVRRRCGTRNYRADSRSPDGIGFMIADVLGLDASSETVRKRVKNLQTLWCNKGALQEVEKKVDGRLKWFVVPGETIGNPESD